MSFPVAFNDSRKRWAHITVICIAQIALKTLLAKDYLRVREALILATLVFMIELIRVISGPLQQKRGLVLGFTLGSISLVLAVNLGAGMSVYQTGFPIFDLLVVWGVLLTLFPFPTAGTYQFSEFHTVLYLILFLIGSAALWILSAANSGGLRPWLIDEVLYLFQSQNALHLPFMQSIDSNLARFFVLRQSYVANGYLIGQYPPGWPLVLSLFQGIYGHWVLLLLLHLWLLVATFAYGRTVASPRVGLFAAFLVSINGSELILSMFYLPHILTAALSITAATLIFIGLDKKGGKRNLFLTLGGILIGFSCAARPLTGLALGLTLILLVLISARAKTRFIWPQLSFIALGAAIPIGYLLWYNFLTTGEMTRFGYDVAEHGLHALGFGRRGFVVYKGSGLPVEVADFFGFKQAIAHFLNTVSQSLINFWPSFIILPLLFVTKYMDVRVPWRWVLPFALLPFVYFFYFYHTSRFLFELFPFAMVGTAWLVAGIWKNNMVAAGAIALIMISTSVIDAKSQILDHRLNGSQIREPFFKMIDSIRQKNSKVLVFVKDVSPGLIRDEQGLETLYAYNFQGAFHGDVVVARDIGADDSILVSKYPGYIPFLLTLVPNRNDGVRRWVPKIAPMGK